MVERLNGHEFEQTQGDVKDREAWCAAVQLQFMVSQIVRHDLPTEQQQDYSKKRVGKYKFLISDMKDKIACISHNKINIRAFHKMLHDNKLNILKEKE